MPSPPITLPAGFDWLPLWAVGLVVIGAALAAALFLHALIVRAVRRGVRRRDAFTRSLLLRTRATSRFALLVAGLSWAVHVAPLSAGLSRTLQHLLLVAFIVLGGWVVMTAADIGSAIYLRRYSTDVADNLHARKLLTQARILRRSLNVLVLVVTVALALMTIPGVKQLGVSLLAAGGAAGIIVGLALQPLLTNIFAGLQLALTQPIRLDDAIVVQGEFGNVEEINSTYVVVRLWDLRRMVVPLKYFLEQPFQNWTRESSDLLGTVLFYTDYSVPADVVRAHLQEVVRASKLWNGKVCALQVTDVRERVLELRGLVSARNSGELFDLRCEVREKMIAWLRDAFPHALPRDRLEFTPAPSRAGPGPGEQRVQEEDLGARRQAELGPGKGQVGLPHGE